MGQIVTNERPTRDRAHKLAEERHPWERFEIVRGRNVEEDLEVLVIDFFLARKV
jgi:hypothetical protein